MPGTGGNGETPIYRSAAFPNATLLEHGITTAYKGFELGLEFNADEPCFGSRPWDPVKNDWADKFEWMSYKEVADRRTKVGAGIMKLADDGKLGDGVRSKFVVGVWCSNRPGKLCYLPFPLSRSNLWMAHETDPLIRSTLLPYPEWQLVNQGVAAYSNTLVSLYDTLGPNGECLKTAFLSAYPIDT